MYIDKDSDGNYIIVMLFIKLIYGIDCFDFVVDSFIFGISVKDSRYSKLLSIFYELSLIIIDVILISDVNGEEEYFDVIIDNNKYIIGFKVIVLFFEMNLIVVVFFILIIKCKDMYGYDVIIKVVMIVNKW